MKKNRILATALAVTLAGFTTPASVLAQQSTTISGTAKDEARQPFTDFSVRAVDTQTRQPVKTVALDQSGSFSLADLSSKEYRVELLNKKGDVVCAEGPYNMAQQAIKSDVVIDCNKVPAAWWLLGAAAAAGITAGVVVINDASPAR